MTREQLVAMLYRYAKFKGKDMTCDGSKAMSMPDWSSVSDWAQENIKWAIDKGVITGKNGAYIAPRRKCPALRNRANTL